MRIEAPTGTVVTDTALSLAGHLAAVEAEERRGVRKDQASVGREYIVLLDTGIWIGRGVEVALVELNDEAQIAVEAPRWMAVSRDDFTMDQHMRYQNERERKNGGRGDWGR